MTIPVSLQSARDLASARAIRQAIIEAHDNQFSIAFEIGLERRALASQRDPVRYFKTVEAALLVLKKIGIFEIFIDVRRWNRK